MIIQIVMSFVYSDCIFCIKINVSRYTSPKQVDVMVDARVDAKSPYRLIIVRKKD